jgi:C-terminal processing protease CtpA/Prc
LSQQHHTTFVFTTRAQGSSTADPVLVESLMPGGPAAASGLIIDGDELMAVDGEDVKFKTMEEVHNMIW